MDAKTLPQVRVPNRDNVILPYPHRIWPAPFVSIVGGPGRFAPAPPGV
jgi:hypothetical protein